MGIFFFFGSLWSSLWQAGSFIEHTDSLVIALRLSCSLGCGILVPQPGIEPMSPGVEAQSSNHWMAREIPDLSILSPGVSCGHLLEKTRPGSKNTGCRGPEAGSGRAYLAATRPCQAAGTRSAEALKQDHVWCVWQQEGHCGGK